MMLDRLHFLRAQDIIETSHTREEDHH